MVHYLGRPIVDLKPDVSHKLLSLTLGDVTEYAPRNYRASPKPANLVRAFFPLVVKRVVPSERVILESYKS